jgi:hypothetical protein
MIAEMDAKWAQLNKPVPASDTEDSTAGPKSSHPPVMAPPNITPLNQFKAPSSVKAPREKAEKVNQQIDNRKRSSPPKNSSKHSKYFKPEKPVFHAAYKPSPDQTLKWIQSRNDIRIATADERFMRLESYNDQQDDDIAELRRENTALRLEVNALLSAMDTVKKHLNLP